MTDIIRTDADVAAVLIAAAFVAADEERKAKHPKRPGRPCTGTTCKECGAFKSRQRK